MAVMLSDMFRRFKDNRRAAGSKAVSVLLVLSLVLVVWDVYSIHRAFASLEDDPAQAGVVYDEARALRATEAAGVVGSAAAEHTTITYHANLPVSQGADASATAEEEAVVGKPFAAAAADEFSCPGYVLVGWAVEPDAGATIAPGATIYADDQGANDLYAIWEAEDGSE